MGTDALRFMSNTEKNKKNQIEGAFVKSIKHGFKLDLVLDTDTKIRLIIIITVNFE